jgi:hypothetical protein
MLDEWVLPLGLTLVGAGSTRCPESDPSTGRENALVRPAGGSDLVGACCNRPSLSCPTAGRTVPAQHRNMEDGHDHDGIDGWNRHRWRRHHLDIHVAAALDHLGGVLGTANFPTTSTGYVELLKWLRQHGRVDRVGVEGTGSYGSGLAQHLQAHGVTVVEVSRRSRQVRRRHGKSDVIDAIAAARAVLAGEATSVPKSHDGSVEALRTLKLLQRKQGSRGRVEPAPQPRRDRT